MYLTENDGYAENMCVLEVIMGMGFKYTFLALLAGKMALSL